MIWKLGLTLCSWRCSPSLCEADFCTYADGSAPLHRRKSRWRSSGSPSITSTICLFEGRLGARRGTSSPSVTQLSYQLVNFTLHVPVILCMGDMTLPSRLTFAGMSCSYTSLTALSLFEAPMWVAMLGTP